MNAAERPAASPVYVSPADDDAARGVTSNEQRIFEYLGQIQKMFEDHVGLLGNTGVSEAFARRRVDHQALEVANAKAVLAGADAETEQDDDPLGQVTSVAGDGAVDCRSGRGGNCDL